MKKVLFRIYPHGEVAGVFPEEPATGDGHYCVAVSSGGAVYPVDIESVLLTTMEASPGQYARLKHTMENDPYKIELVVIDEVEATAGETTDVRKKAKKDLEKFPPLRVFP